MDPTAGASLSLTLLAIIGVLVHRLLRLDHDPREPPLLPTKIPLFGHVIGLYRYGKQYYQKMEEKYGYDIYTLALPGIKQYVITTPALTAAVSRQSKLISFRPVIVNFGRKLMLFDDASHAINEKNLFDEDGPGIITASHDVFYNNLPSGPVLDDICQVLLDDAAAIFNKLSSSKEGGEINTHLVDFCKNVIGFPTMKAFWGPDNILAKDPSLLADFWDMDAGQVRLGVGILPALTARKAHRGRARLQAAMAEYYESGAWLRASPLIRQRAQAHFDRGYTKRMFARSDTGLLVGALPNSTFTTFWLLARLFADRALLAAVGAELTASGTVTTRGAGGEGDDGEVVAVDVAGLRARCPLFASAFRETLRLGMPMSSVRAVREDVMLADRYLLRKGSLVLIDAGVMHTKPSIWGGDAASFNPRRFVDSQAGEFTAGDEPGRRVHPAAFRAFGGGEVFCPGRNLALIEVMGVVAPLVCGWELVGDEVIVPPPLDDVMPVGVWKPRGDVAVRLRRREGWEGVRWEYKV